MSAPTPREELISLARSLGAEECAVLVFLARRLLVGQRQYGRLDLATDGRDFVRERAEELADALVYTACDELRRVVGGGT